MTHPPDSPASTVAVWALILGICALVLSVGGAIALAALDLSFFWIALVLGVLLAVGAIISGHFGIPDTSARHGRRGRSKAVTGLVLGYACLALGLFLFPAKVLPQALDAMDDNPQRMQQRAFADAIRACESALADALANGEEFKCKDAQDRLPERWRENVAIVDTAPNSCMILYVPDGSFTAAALPWNNSP